MGGCRHIALARQVRQKRLNLDPLHRFRMRQPVKPNKKSNPVNVDYLSGKRKMMERIRSRTRVTKRGLTGFSRSLDKLYITTVM